MYDPTIGRWFTEDPIGFDGGDANLYRYVGNNSTDEIDPSGKIGIFIDGYMYAKEDHTIIGAIYNAYPGRENVKNFTIHHLPAISIPLFPML